jgi:amino-acid N-acetyltransferase
VSETRTRSAFVRRARTSDVLAIRDLLDEYTDQRILLSKETVTLFEDVQEFWVAEVSGAVVGCGALHVMWEDLAEVRTLAVHPAHRGQGIGQALLERLLETATDLEIARVFCLTFEVDFFAHHGFEVIDGTPVSPEVFAQLLRSYDEGVAEFLGLERVKPNTLGNTRMLLHLDRARRDAIRMPTSPTLIDTPIRIAAAGTPPKLIDEVVGRVNTKDERISLAHMRSPAGWREPGQRPDFDEFTYVLHGELHVEHAEGRLVVPAGSAVHTRPGEWVRYSTPGPDGAEYIAVCLPAFDSEIVHRDPE